MKLGYTIAYVPDVAASLTFFTAAHRRALSQGASELSAPDGTLVELCTPMAA
jgi:hypothetical protein